ncbi:hypothetical protein N183_20585 [Sinorhizobium sp. Sb3]|nr:hypothetical protein N183_20585 [Sinorhizobium sp. Sb3]
MLEDRGVAKEDLPFRAGAVAPGYGDIYAGLFGKEAAVT